VRVSKHYPKASLGLVAQQLETYAHRGVFRSFSQIGARGQLAEFRFHWLWNLPFHLTFDGKRGSLSFKKLLSNVPPGTGLDTELKDFVKSCCSPERPEHRRLDPKDVSVRYTNRRGTVTVTFVVAESDYEQGVKHALNLISEMFVGFLNVRYPEYLQENFGLPED